MPVSRTLSVMLTYACNASCKDCGTFSSPRDKSNATLSQALATIDEAKDLGFANVVFTGGEATLRWDDLLVGIRHCSSKGLPTRLVTNGHWATDPEGPVRELVAAGLTEINFSTGDEHRKYIPVGTVASGVIASLAAGLRVAVMVERRDRATTTKATLIEEMEDLAPGSSLHPMFSVVESPWMPMRSDAAGYTSDAAATLANVAARHGCDSVLQTYVLQGNGVLASCCGLGMRRVKELQHGHAGSDGSLRRTIDEAEGDLVKQAIRTIGPEKLLAWAAEKDPSIKWEGMYAHRCHACLRIYDDDAVQRVFMAHGRELLPDIVFGRFLDEIELPALFDGDHGPAASTA